jgi:hypothetical protein
MANNAMHYPKERVKAFRAYFEQSRKSAKGRPEQADLEVVVRLCDQLLSFMECPGKPGAEEGRVSAAH